MTDKKTSSKKGGKWILSGEHTVLRGGSAILFPLPADKLYFEIQYEKSNCFHVKSNSDQIKKNELFFKQVIQKALTWIEKPKIGGCFYLEHTLPAGAGLGSSAAFCLCLADIFFQQGWIQKKRILELALKLENEFHGKSSGADLQVIYSNQPIFFKSFNDVKFLKPKWRPYFYLLDTGQRSSTKKYVQKVRRFAERQPLEGRLADQMMRGAVSLCAEALNQDSKKGFKLLIRAFKQAAVCFEKWGLCDTKTQRAMAELKNQGAAAVKPTGSGGGFIVGLWKEPPPSLLKKNYDGIFI